MSHSILHPGGPTDDEVDAYHDNSKAYHVVHEPDPLRWERIGRHYRLKATPAPGPNSNTLVSDILWLASAEFGRQRSEGFRFRPTSLERDGLNHFYNNGRSRVWTTEQE